MLSFPLIWFQIKKNHYQDQFQGAYICSLPGVFMASGLTFKSLIPFWVKFCVWCKIMDQFHFFYMWLSNFSNTIYWRDCPFPIVYSCLLHCTLVEYIHMVLVLGSILLHWSMSIFMPMPYCFDYHSFVIQFSIRECVPPAFFFFFRVLFFWLLGFSNLYLKMPPLNIIVKCCLWKIWELQTIVLNF